MQDIVGQKSLTNRFGAALVLLLVAGLFVACGSDNRCGNGRVDPGEQCDYNQNDNGQCPNGGIGHASCTRDCVLDLSHCLVCGNGFINEDQGEECEPGDLGGATCLSLGTTGGTLRCTDCRYNTEGCTGPQCGNGVLEGSEECDAPDYGGLRCEGLGYTGGTPGCNDVCVVSEDPCWTCGDGVCEWQSGESVTLCEADCPAVCSDDRCDLWLGEGPQNCPEDCSFKAIAAGGRHSCALHRGGSVSCWGANEAGQLGRADPATSPWPGTVAGISRASGPLAAGEAHSCVVDEDGGIQCWGQNTLGELGWGAGDATWIPQTVPWITDIERLAAGMHHTCAVDSAGAGWCWGSNDRGQLGVGTVGPVFGPVQVQTNEVLQDITAGRSHTCALTTSHTVLCWGDNSKGQLSYPLMTSSALPVFVPRLSGVEVVAAGEHFTCALESAGQVACWGANQQAVMGRDAPEHSATPIYLDRFPDMRAIQVGYQHACVLLNDQEQLFCWGDNTHMQLRQNSWAMTDYPVPLNMTIATMTLGGGHTCVLEDSMTARCLGRADAGQLGDGTVAEASDWVTVFMPY